MPSFIGQRPYVPLGDRERGHVMLVKSWPLEYDADKGWATEERAVRTADGVEIVDGMAVWDYDLDRVTVDTRDARVEGSQVWFHVIKPDGGSKLMSDTRVCVRHPFTGKPA